MIEDLEAELAGAPKETSNTNNVALAEEANFGEANTVEANDNNEMELFLNKN